MNTAICIVIATALFMAVIVEGFQIQTTSRGMHVQSRIGKGLSMEYIPDGMSKEQWAKIKAKEKEKEKGKNYGAVGITKFKSRSFEAWQKSGGKNLFPVDPTTPMEERPYMQRPGGKPDGSDLKKKGLFGRGQGKGVESKVDEKYDKLEKEGKLRSSPFSVPWTAAAAEQQAKERAAKTKEARIAAAQAKNGKVPTGKKGVLKKGAKAAEPEEASEPPKKKGFFGLF